MRTRRVLFLSALVISVATAASPPDNDPARAAQPLSDGVPEVAVVRLRELLAHSLPPAEQAAAKAKLAEALLAAGAAEEALPLFEPTPATAFLRAQALAALQRWSEALPLYQEAATQPPHQGEARFGAAEAARALGHREEALRWLSAAAADPRWRSRANVRSAALLLDDGKIDEAARLLEHTDAKTAGERREKRFLRGRVAVARGDRDRAIELFQSVLKSPEGASHSLIIATLLATADLNLQAKSPDNGVRALEEFIEHHPGDPNLAAVFDKLRQLYAAQRHPSRTELARWANDAAQPRRALAQWSLARMQQRMNDSEAALATYERLRSAPPSYPPLAEAYLDYARLLIDRRRFDEATAVLLEARALHPAPALTRQLDFTAGEAEFRARRWHNAAQNFLAAAGEESGEAPRFDAAMAWLEAGEPQRAEATVQDTESRGAVMLEEALLQAARRDPKAANLLRNFLHEFPEHPRRAEAWVALAELAYHAAPPRIEEAETCLARADQSHPGEGAKSRADYLRVWIADASADPGKANVIARATEFLQAHAGSKFASDVRMKLAEAYYRRQDFASAQTQFELLAQQNPTAPLVEQALFFAAESASKTMSAGSLDHALALLNEVVKRDGEMKWPARNEQALIERRIGRSHDAIAIYDEVLAGAAQPPEKREALCGKADTLYEMGAGDPAKYQVARALYEQLAGEEGAPALWKNQALVKAALCLEKSNDRAQALETLYRVIEQETRPDRPPEFFWFYKAGFNAARLLEEQAKWAAAASVYQKLAQAGGDRSDEAKSRLAQLRLEHFLWP
jgi:tetratricopeptide (TPR) repeat protein